MKNGIKGLGNILLRIVAVFAASGLGVIGAGAIAGISTVKAVTVAGLTAVAAVVEKLARGFMNDGKLDRRTNRNRDRRSQKNNAIKESFGYEKRN